MSQTVGAGTDDRRHGNRAHRDAARLLGIVFRALVAIALFVLPHAAAAHHRGGAHAAPADAIVIPNLAHGQMTVLSANRSAILDLAARMPRTDPTFRRLLAFINLQFSACMWGLMPGSVTDENSPFNECTHAHLAATKALLVHMQGMDGNRDAVEALVAKIRREMAASGTSLVMCRFSDEPFNTAERISPRWNELLFHPPSMIALIGSGLMGLGAVWLFLVWTRRSPDGARAGRSPA